MYEAMIQPIGLFHYFTTLDEPLALQLTIRTYQRISKIKDLNSQQQRVELIRHCEKVYIQRSDKERVQSSELLKGGFSFPLKLDLSPWRQFKKESHINEYHAVIWSRILGFSEEEIAMGLEISVGTVRHRIARGLRVLGKSCV